MPKITKKTVDSLKADSERNPLWDDEIKGFGVRCRPSGAKTYVLKYRVGSRQRWETIGRHGSPWTPEMARAEAKRLLGDIVQGKDPAVVREQARLATTVGELCDLFLAERIGTRKPSTVRLYRGHIANHIVPLIGHKKIGELNRNDIELLQYDVGTGKTAAAPKPGRPRGRATPRGGKGAGGVDHDVGDLRLWGRQEAVDGKPVRRGQTLPAGRKERFLSAAEMVRLGKALAAAEAEGVNRDAVAAIRLLALSGMRLGEVFKSAVERGRTQLSAAARQQDGLSNRAAGSCSLRGHCRATRENSRRVCLSKLAGQRTAQRYSTHLAGYTKSRRARRCKSSRSAALICEYDRQ